MKKSELLIAADTNEPGEIRVARLAAVGAAALQARRQWEELLHITKPGSEKTEGVVWEEV